MPSKKYGVLSDTILDHIELEFLVAVYSVNNVEVTASGGKTGQTLFVYLNNILVSSLKLQLKCSEKEIGVVSSQMLIVKFFFISTPC